MEIFEEALNLGGSICVFLGTSCRSNTPSLGFILAQRRILSRAHDHASVLKDHSVDGLKKSKRGGMQTN